MHKITIWSHFDNESKIEDLVRFTNGTVFKVGNIYNIKINDVVHVLEIGDYVGKSTDGFIILKPYFENKKRIDKTTPLRTQSELDNDRLTEMINTVRKFRQDEMVIKTKPISTQSELDNERLTEIVDAIGRYRKAEMAIPTQWIEEYNTIIERIKNNPK